MHFAAAAKHDVYEALKRIRMRFNKQLPSVILAAVCGNSVTSWLIGRADLRVRLYWTGSRNEYLEWARAAPRSEPGQVRKEAAIRDR